MKLRLNVTRHMRAPVTTPLLATIDARGGSIGRKASNDLVLPDRSLEVSRQHARIDHRDGDFIITDTSRNGLLLNGNVLGRDETACLAHGDTLTIGNYEVEVAIEVEATPDSKAVGWEDPFAKPAEEPLMRDVEPDGLGDDMAPGRGLMGDEQPRDVLDILNERDPLEAPRQPEREVPDGGFHMPQERAPPHEESLPRMSEPAPAAPDAGERTSPDSPGNGIASSQAQLLPADWKPRSQAPGQERVVEPITPIVKPEPPPAAPLAALTPDPEAPPHHVPEEQDWEATGAETLTPIDARLLDAFLEGLDLPDFNVDDDEAAAVLEITGRVLREAVHGVRRVLIARGKIKDSFRLPITRLERKENNPLKFSVGAEDALEKLLAPDPKGYMPPVQSVREVFEDLEIHEVAVITGMRAALKQVLEQFEPEALEARLETDFLDSFVPAARKARLWELFTEHYEKLHREAKDAFDELYGKEFAHAYEIEIRALKTEQESRKPATDHGVALDQGSARRDES